MKKTVEDALHLISENAAIVQSAMYDPAMDQVSQSGVGRLASEIHVLSEQIRGSLDSSGLLTELISVPNAQ